MIYGANYWNNKDIHYVQTNNAVENIDDDALSHCGSSASLTCVSSLYYPEIEKAIPKVGNYSIQLDDVMSLFMNDNRNEKALMYYRELKSYKGDYQQVPQYYPYAIKSLFGKDCYYIGYNIELTQQSKDSILNNQINSKTLKWDYLKYWLKCGYSVQCVLKKPGHYISIVAYDDDKNEMIYYDPWPNRLGLKNRGIQERMSLSEFLDNVKKYCIVYT
jgi:hypothetical protein